MGFGDRKPYSFLQGGTTRSISLCSVGWVTSREGLQLSFQATPSTFFITRELFCLHPGSTRWALAAPESPWHFSHAGNCSCSLWGRNPNSHKNMVQWSEISSWNWPGPDNALSNFFACLFLPTSFPVVFFCLSFLALYNSPPGRALASLRAGETWTRGDAATSCVDFLSVGILPLLHLVPSRITPKGRQGWCSTPQSCWRDMAFSKLAPVAWRPHADGASPARGAWEESWWRERPVPPPISTIWSQTISLTRSWVTKLCSCFDGDRVYPRAGTLLLWWWHSRTSVPWGRWEGGERKERGGWPGGQDTARALEDVDVKWLSWPTWL